MCAHSLVLCRLFSATCVRVSPAVHTLYVPIAGRHVTCQDSRVQGEVFFFFFFSFFPPLQSRLIPGASSPSCAHRRSALRNDQQSRDGWMEGWTDGCAYLVENPRKCSCDYFHFFWITFDLRGRENNCRGIIIIFLLPRRERERGERLGALENTESRGSCVWELPIPSR